MCTPPPRRRSPPWGGHPQRGPPQAARRVRQQPPALESDYEHHAVPPSTGDSWVGGLPGTPFPRTTPLPLTPLPQSAGVLEPPRGAEGRGCGRGQAQLSLICVGFFHFGCRIRRSTEDAVFSWRGTPERCLRTYPTHPGPHCCQFTLVGSNEVGQEHRAGGGGTRHSTVLAARTSQCWRLMRAQLCALSAGDLGR